MVKAVPDGGASVREQEPPLCCGASSRPLTPPNPSFSPRPLPFLSFQTTNDHSNHFTI